MIALGEPLTDADHLRFGFTLAEHYFRLTLPQLTMMVESRVIREIIVIANRFDGQPRKPVKRSLRRSAAARNFLQNLEDPLGRHAATSW